MNLIDLAERGLVPDGLIRVGIRRLLARRLREQRRADPEARRKTLRQLVGDLRRGPLAEQMSAANEQHYEVPAAFYEQVLGPRLKYSCCLFADGNEPLAEAEERMLELTCERAQIEDGMEILELGCGWGALTLWIAEHYPRCRVVALSNAHGQRRFLQERLRQLGTVRVEVLTADVAQFDPRRRFDRVVSVEMFEHMRNYALLLERIAGWLQPAGKLFVHLFCHRDTAYLFEARGASDWMARHFFTGGMMPSEDLLGHFQDDLLLERQWRVDGRHYARTCEAWLGNLDRHREAARRALAGDRSADRQVQRWRMFFLACAELFRYGQGQEWFVAHYLMRKQPVETARPPGLGLDVTVHGPGSGSFFRRKGRSASWDAAAEKVPDPLGAAGPASTP